MVSLPLDIQDNIFKYLTLIELIKYYTQNERFKDAAARQLATRCAKIQTSDFIGWKISTLRNILPHIGPYIQQFTINGTLRMYEVNRAILEFTPNIQFLHFITDEFIDNKDWGPIHSETLPKLGIIARLCHRQNGNIKNLKINQNLQHLSMTIKYGTVNISFLAEHLQKLTSLDLYGDGIIIQNIHHLATLIHLVRLNVQVNNEIFRKYPEALCRSQQKLQELNISLNNVRVTLKLAISFDQFIHLKKLRIYIDDNVGHAQYLPPIINDLGKYRQLESLEVLGFTEYLHLDYAKSELSDIKDLRVCFHFGECKCKTRYYVRDTFFNIK